MFPWVASLEESFPQAAGASERGSVDVDKPQHRQRPDIFIL